MATEIKIKPSQRGSFGTAFWAGILGAILLTVVFGVARFLGLSSMNLEMALGSLFSGTLSSGAWTLGFVVHLALGGIFGLIYAGIFNSMRRASTGLGATIGFFHWIVAGVFLGVMPALHPLISETLPAPGWFALNTNFITFLLVLGVHLGFGALVGSFYARSVLMGASRGKLPEERPVTRIRPAA